MTLCNACGLRNAKRNPPPGGPIVNAEGTPLASATPSQYYAAPHTTMTDAAVNKKPHATSAATQAAAAALAAAAAAQHAVVRRASTPI